jgi:hypothetical protein
MNLTKWTLPEGREPITDDELVALTRRMVGSSIDYKERYEAEKERAEILEELLMDVVADLRDGVPDYKIDYRIGKVILRMDQ